MRDFKKIFICFAFVLLSCQQMGQIGGNEPEDPYSEDSGEGRSDRDERGGFESESSRDSEIRRLKSDRVIEAELKSRYDGGYYYEGYGGEKCLESAACEALCDSQPEISGENRKRCYKSPRALVEKLEEGFFTLLNISDADSVDISPGLIAGMLDINVRLVSKLVRDRMSEGDLKSFLAWVAVNKGIAAVFLEEDRRSDVMKEAFEQLGEFQPDAKKEELTGLNMGLIQDEDTFFHLSALEDNFAAFEIAHKVLKSVCRTKDCKMGVFCARLLEARERSRIFGHRSRDLKCRTSAKQARRSRRDGICYVHGAASWSYLNELINEGDIKDNDFKGAAKEITVDKCNSFCGDKDSGKCARVL